MAASNTDDRDDDVPGDTPRELGDDDVASRWADIVATLGDMDVSRADGETDGAEKSAASSQTSRPGDEGSDDGGDDGGDLGGDKSPGADGARGGAAGDRDGAGRGTAGPRVSGWSDGGWAGGDWTVGGAASGSADAGSRDGSGTGPDAGSRATPPSGPRDWPLSPDAEALEEADSHFTPPEPPALLSRDPLLTMAWSFVVGIPVLAVVGMIVSAAVPAVSIPPLAGQIGLGLFVAGLGVLIWRMPHQRDPDDDGPGAVV
ncbi:hypothetical protein GCM10010413_17060 [Promicromonospora sukumoe]|uniref:Uncharacterized protein n=1 Tax=Promicromonospora sukumoe TaxID=88382 RepID=A0A7W3JA34_9MICO|nr:hypothetical protein [Promicromonospora sukumoe]MBA8809073.1 hypothetical protein [Promicromonospora sukumoe]